MANSRDPNAKQAMASPPIDPDLAPDELRRTFKALAEEWREATGGLSSPSQIALHPAYQRIIEMGDQALPLILEELTARGGQWYWALKAIAGGSPVPPEAAGRPKQVKEAWLEWGRANGYIR
jgi:hypothetical protein